MASDTTENDELIAELLANDFEFVENRCHSKVLFDVRFHSVSFDYADSQVSKPFVCDDWRDERPMPVNTRVHELTIDFVLFSVFR
jgi:hypothetical protein